MKTEKRSVSFWRSFRNAKERANPLACPGGWVHLNIMPEITQHQLIHSLSKAIAFKEGFTESRKVGGVSTTSRALKNPGNIRAWKDPSGIDYPKVDGIVSFPSVRIGWVALRAQCKINVVKRRLTLMEFFCGKPGTYKGFLPQGTQTEIQSEYVRDIAAIVSKDLGCAVPLSLPVSDLINTSHNEDECPCQ